MPTVLIVDDEQHMCDVCSRTLRRSGYQVATTNDPNDAVLRMSTGQRFDLLLTDIKMPAMSGLDLARIAREYDPSIAIIIMTGFASYENMQQSVQRGIADFLSKPFELEQLRHAVEQALHKRTRLQDKLRLGTLEQTLANSETLLATLELPELSEALLRISLEQSGCQAGFVLLADGALPPTLLAASAESELLASGTQLARQAIQQRHNVVGVDEPFCTVRGQELRYALTVTLRAQGEVNGILLLCDAQPSALQPGVQEELALIANHAGGALRNAALYRQLGDAYQRLQELDRLKSEFISIASHELRTPLSIVLGYTMMIRDRTTGEQHEYARRVFDSAQRIKEIVDDMVSLRYLETGQDELRLERCVLGEIVTEAAARARQAATDRQHELRTETPAQTVYLLCDREKVLLILGHLLANAVRFTPNGGTITVRSSVRPACSVAELAGDTLRPAVVPTISQPLPWLVLEVQDTGVGVPQHERNRIFERFYQVKDSLTRDHGGTGLGLAIVRELVVALNGAVWVSSATQQGSVFAVALPYRQA